MHGYKLID
jgi:hypothetical protein